MSTIDSNSIQRQCTDLSSVVFNEHTNTLSHESPQSQFEFADSQKKVRVLVVDDHPLMRQALFFLLKAEPCLEVVGEASSGESALELARNLHPDVVLMDICMPGMGGIQATKALHHELPDIRVIGLSILGKAQSLDAMRRAGAVCCFTKGANLSDMISAIRACV